ncbi:MAG TPA: RDD family protein [Pirellulaceae bacterium]|nr:RDD family protein [Pirellulaceae bacterium]
MAAEVTKQLDDTIEIVTPENIAFDYRLAGPFRRFLAYLIDYMIRVAAFIAICMVMCLGIGQFLGAATIGVLFITFFLLSWFYGGLFESLMNGQTPGKRMLGIRVLTVDGQPVNGMQAVMRNILRTADEIPMLTLQAFPWLNDIFMEATDQPNSMAFIPTFVMGLIVMASNRRFQRLGDLVCGTMVLIEERQWLTGAVKLEDPRAAQLAEYIPANFVVTRTMARAIASYADRRRFFSPARRREVARHLAEPLLTLFQLPLDTSHDLLLCALYHRTFVLQRADERAPAPRPTMQASAPSTPIYGR